MLRTWPRYFEQDGERTHLVVERCGVEHEGLEDVIMHGSHVPPHIRDWPNVREDEFLREIARVKASFARREC